MSLLQIWHGNQSWNQFGSHWYHSTNSYFLSPGWLTVPTARTPLNTRCLTSRTTPLNNQRVAHSRKLKGQAVRLVTTTKHPVRLVLCIVFNQAGLLVVDSHLMSLSLLCFGWPHLICAPDASVSSLHDTSLVFYCCALTAVASLTAKISTTSRQMKTSHSFTVSSRWSTSR